tara:strand:- start:36 stop:308 length:273 start_codon:yes stop_codon:yes gene_type:complete
MEVKENMDKNFIELVRNTTSTMEEIRGRRRNAYIVDNRRYIARELTKMGYKRKDISRLLNKDESSIRNLLKNDRGAPQREEERKALNPVY